MEDDSGKFKKNKDFSNRQLTPEQYYIFRQSGTEPAFSGIYNEEKSPGIYLCVCCDAKLFSSDAKYDSGSGWPSFYKPIKADAVKEIEDYSHGMRRIEVQCRKCNSHLGHVFPDGPEPTGIRYCINSISLNLDLDKG